MATLLAPASARACVQDPALFTSTDVVDHRHAARFCRVCPVQVACWEATEETAKRRPDLLRGTYAGRRFGDSR